MPLKWSSRLLWRRFKQKKNTIWFYPLVIKLYLKLFLNRLFIKKYEYIIMVSLLSQGWNLKIIMKKKRKEKQFFFQNSGNVSSKKFVTGLWMKFSPLKFLFLFFVAADINLLQPGFDFKVPNRPIVQFDNPSLKKTILREVHWICLEHGFFRNS